MPGLSGPQRLAVVRSLVGAHLLLWLLVDLPHLTELYGRETFRPGRVASFVVWFISLDAAIAVGALAVVVGGVGLVGGVARRGAAAVAFAGDTLLLELNPAIRSPELPLVRLLLLLLVLLPVVEPKTPWSKKETTTTTTTTTPEETQRHLRAASLAMCVFLAIASCSAGLAKLGGGDAAWLDGTALSTLLAQSAWARPFWHDVALPGALLWLLSWGALLLEILAPLVLVRWFRFPWWIASLCMHLAALALFSIPQVSLGMVLVHLFVAVDVGFARRR